MATCQAWRALIVCELAVVASSFFAGGREGRLGTPGISEVSVAGRRRHNRPLPMPIGFVTSLMDVERRRESR
jgi:hypothetical protein